MKDTIKVTIDDLWEFGDELTAQTMEDDGETETTISKDECSEEYWKAINKFMTNKEVK